MNKIMEQFISIFFGLFCVLVLAFIRLYVLVKKDRRVIFTELMESRHRVNKICNDACEYLHDELEEKRKTRELTDQERNTWEATREVMRQYKIECKKYNDLFKS